MHFHLSTNAASDLKIKDFVAATGDCNAFCQHWYVHRVIFDRRKHVIVMEAHTRYALIFCGVAKPFFANFPEIIADTLWRHIVALCEVPEFKWNAVKTMIAAMCAENIWHKGLNKSVQAHIKDAARDTVWILVRDELPPDLTNPGQLFQLTMSINETFRSRFGEKEYIVPLKEFQRLWQKNLP